MTSTSMTPRQSPAAPNISLESLESSLNKIFLAVGDFLEFNSRTSSLGLEPFSHKPHDEARRGLDTNLETFQSSCDSLEIQIVRAKQVLRREIELLNNPVVEPEPEKVEEVEEIKEEVEEMNMEEVNGETGEEAKVEENEEDVELDEEGLFTSEFDNLMDPNGFQSELGFGENMDWMNDV